MSYIGKKPVDFNDVTEAQTFTVTGDLTVDTNTLYVDSTNNNVGIGTSSPTLAATIVGDDGDPASSGSTATGALQIQQGTNDVVLEAGVKSNSDRYAWIQATNKADHVNNYNLSLNPNGGDVLVGKTSSGIGTAGIELQGSNNRIFVTRSGDSTLYLNRTTSDGSIPEFLKELQSKLKGDSVLDLKDNKKRSRLDFKSMVKGTWLGSLIGFIPGPSAILASIITYNSHKDKSKIKERIISSESANNSAAVSSMLPFLFVGLPITLSEMILSDIMAVKTFVLPLDLKGETVLPGVNYIEFCFLLVMFLTVSYHFLAQSFLKYYEKLMKFDRLKEGLPR